MTRPYNRKLINLMELKFQAKVVTIGSDVKAKSNNGTYVVTTVELLDGPAKGKHVFANRTLTNKDGIVKSEVKLDQEITVHGTTLVNRDNGKPMIMWEIQAGATVTDADEINALLGIEAPVETVKL